MFIRNHLRMSRGGSFVIKENEFFYGEHSKTILRNRLRMYYGVIRGNENDNGFICKNVIVFISLITELPLSRVL